MCASETQHPWQGKRSLPLGPQSKFLHFILQRRLSSPLPEPVSQGKSQCHRRQVEGILGANNSWAPRSSSSPGRGASLSVLTAGHRLPGSLGDQPLSRHLRPCAHREPGALPDFGFFQIRLLFLLGCLGPVVVSGAG